MAEVRKAPGDAGKITVCMVSVYMRMSDAILADETEELELRHVRLGPREVEGWTSVLFKY